MKLQNLFYLLVAATVFVYSCSDDDEVDPQEFQVNFKDHGLQGEINDSSFFYLDGFVTSKAGSGGVLHVFEILDTLVDTVNCISVVDTIRKIKFSYTDNNTLVVAGRTNLFFAPGASPSDIVTVRFFYYDEDTVSQTVVVSQGAYEILNVDTALNIIEGRMHVKEDGKNQMNGNFTLRYCSY